MKATDVGYGKVQTAMFKLFQELGEDGAEVIRRINDEDAFRLKVASFMLRGEEPFVPSVVQTAKAIMGRNCFDAHVASLVTEQIRGFGSPDPRLSEIEKAGRFPYSEGLLSASRNDCFLVYSAPVSPNCLQECDGATWKCLCTDTDYLSSELWPVAPLKEWEREWFLISKRIGTGSLDVQNGERLATIAEFLYTSALYKAKFRRHKLLPDSRTSSGLLIRVALCAKGYEGGEIYVTSGMNTDYFIIPLEEFQDWKDRIVSEYSVRQARIGGGGTLDVVTGPMIVKLPS